MDDEQRKAMFAKKNGNGSKPASNTVDSNATKVSNQVPAMSQIMTSSGKFDATIGKPPSLSNNVLSEIKSLSQEDDIHKIGEPYGDSRAKYMVTMSDGSEWLVYDDYDEMKFDAEDRVREDLQNEPELFNQDWLESYMTVSETDARLFGNDFTPRRRLCESSSRPRRRN